MKKNGFVSTTMIYSFFLVFLIVLISIVSNYTTNRLTMNSNKDEIKEGLDIDSDDLIDICEDMTMAECLVEINDSDLYHHDENLENGANDDSYRYAGSNPNNYVCFGSDSTTCPKDNLYRIIGVFDGQIKLIKADYGTEESIGFVGTEINTSDYNKYEGDLAIVEGYDWGTENIWSESPILEILIGNFYNAFEKKWKSLIAEQNWFTGFSVARYDEQAWTSHIYELEIENATHELSVPVGLMYISDYVYANSQTSAWGDRSVTIGQGIELYNETNWMYMGINEHTITPMAQSDDFIWMLNSDGNFITNPASEIAAIRPVFYLKNTVSITEGKGTEDNPYRIKGIDEEGTLAKYLKDNVDIIDGLNYHNVSLENSAGDNSYRFSGSNDVDNYVCFGSTATTCPEDNLYRIIGVFNDRVKLIKATVAKSNLLGTNGDYSSENLYYWNNATKNNNWSESELNKVNLNKNFLNSVGSNWATLIAKTTWNVGGGTYQNIIQSKPCNIYSYEVGINKKDVSYRAKIGLVYESDYAFARVTDDWNTDLSTASIHASDETNWMYTGIDEWTITPTYDKDNPIYVYPIYIMEAVGKKVTEALSVRPVFYLKPEVIKYGGTGAKTNPYRIYEKNNDVKDQNMATYLKDHVDDIEGFYYHSSSLENGANDNSYRFSGLNVNNYVCFGSSAKICSTDNLYRIIGVFNDRVKLMKSDYANSNLLGVSGDYSEETYSDITYNGNLNTINRYYWNNTTKNNTWSESKLNKTNLNSNFLNTIGTSWSNKIVNSTWNIGGGTYQNIIQNLPYNIYKYEVGSNKKDVSYQAKVGLIYESDYAYAYDIDDWDIVLNNAAHTASQSNWMYTGIDEWTITRNSDGTTYAYPIYNLSSVSSLVTNSKAIRPAFYLNSETTIASGSGTKSNPYRIKITTTESSNTTTVSIAYSDGVAIKIDKSTGSISTSNFDYKDTNYSSCMENLTISSENPVTVKINNKTYTYSALNLLASITTTLETTQVVGSLSCRAMDIEKIKSVYNIDEITYLSYSYYYNNNSNLEVS